MATRPTLIERYEDNILVGATVTATPAPMDSYDENTLLTHRPSARVLFGGDGSPGPDINLRFDLDPDAFPAGGRADILVIPVWNADGTVTLTNDAGLNETIPLLSLPSNGLPRTLAVDLRVLEPLAATRTSDGFNLIIAGQSEALVMGGAVMLYTAREFPDRDFRWEFKQRIRGNVIEHVNDHGTDLVYSLRTMNRSIDLTTLASEDDRDALEEWFEANFGRGLPCFVWLDPDGRNRPYFGRVSLTFDESDTWHEAIEISLTIDELGKGKPVTALVNQVVGSP